MMTLPLDGVRILDLTQVMAGPFATMTLADLGADVVKIEPPGTGDQARRGAGHFRDGEDTAGFLALNRNKRSVVLDLKSEAGIAAFYALSDRADVVIENFRPGVTRRLGIDHEALRARNPALIYASISGFGQTGPYAQRPGFDLIAQAMSGVMSVTGEPGGSPVKCGIPISDLGAGLMCANAILAAYIERLTSGEGQYLDTSLFEAALALSVWETTELWATGEVPQPYGSAHRLNAPYQALPTADGYVVVAANNQRLWTRLCEAIGRTELIEDERFTTNLDRLHNVGMLTEELSRTFKERPTAEWVETLLAAGTPAGPIHDYRQAVEDPHTRARDMVVTVQHPVEGEIEALGIPVKFSRTPGSVRRAAPLLGEHTREVLAEVGHDADPVADVSADREDAT
jgi:crotonobetainyl-CoA:carnitine CoA-transferase CaiB-like acyl-CoA transferase